VQIEKAGIGLCFFFFYNHPVAEKISSSSIAVRLFHAAINTKKEID